MINFRYHIVSLTAVFLALVIGILMGTTVVSKATVDGLKANVRRAEARSAAVHRTNDELTDELSSRTRVAQETDDALTEQVLAHTVEGRLDRVPVLVIATDDLDTDLLDGLHTVLDDAGADVQGTLVVTDRLGDDGKDADRLRELLEVPERSDPREAAATRLAELLAGSGSEPVESATTSTAPEDEPSTTRSEAPSTTAGIPEVSDPPDGPDVLEVLEDEGFVKLRSSDSSGPDDRVRRTLESDEAETLRYVVATGPRTEVVDTTFLMPLVATMARSGPVPQVVATGPADPADPTDTDGMLSDLLDRDGVAGHVSTVDDLGSYAGDVALVFALVDAAEGRFGNYGIGSTADTVLPHIAAPGDGRNEPSR